MKEKQITPGDAGRRLDRYLGRTFPSLPRSLMYKEIRKKNIKVNKKRCTPEQVLSAGDRVTLYLPDDVLAEKTVYYDFLSASKALDVVYEDENLLILNKPQGLLCHPNGKEYIDTLIARVKRYLYERNQWSPEDSGFAPALANRIDRNTGGLVIAAKTAPALREITALIRERKIEKFYLTVTEGTLSPLTCTRTRKRTRSPCMTRPPPTAWHAKPVTACWTPRRTGRCWR